MTPPIRVAVFTGTRAEYGLLAPLLRQIHQHEALELHLLVSGTHLSHLHGYTIEHIIADGFVPDARLESILASDSAQSVCKALALTVIDVGGELERSKCDYLVILGDRFEALAAATAAVVHGVPIVHLHGGEASEGAKDDRFRHAITKLADLHFVAGPEFAKRVRQMGEPEDRIFVCGPAVQDVLSSLTTVDRSELETILNTTFEAPTASARLPPCHCRHGGPCRGRGSNHRRTVRCRFPASPGEPAECRRTGQQDRGGDRGTIGRRSANRGIRKHRSTRLSLAAPRMRLAHRQLVEWDHRSSPLGYANGQRRLSARWAAPRNTRSSTSLLTPS